MVDRDPTHLQVKLELVLSCTGLVSLDVLSKSDPFIVLYEVDAYTKRQTELARTETVINATDLTFTQRLFVNYKFEEVQHLKFEVRDDDGHSNSELIGHVTCRVADLVTTADGKYHAKIKPPHGSADVGTLTVRSHEVKASNAFLCARLSGVKLDKKDLFGKSDPFLRVFRKDPDGTEVQVFETEVIPNTLDPVWKPVRLSLSSLCNADPTSPFTIKCYDWDSNTRCEYIGEVTLTLESLLGADVRNTDPNFHGLTKQYTLFKPMKAKNTKPHGDLVLTNVKIVENPSFIDFVRGGMQIGLMVAVDFTGSNGHPDDYQSLHFRRGQRPNEYQQAIRAIGDIVAPYDADQKFPIWGFGASINKEVNHCFSLVPELEVPGVDGLLRAYDHAFSYVQLSGPTYFTPVIQAAAAIASRPYQHNFQHYSVLVILTDGAINDMPATIRAIVDASTRPLSIIIVGVGAADFTSMTILDGDSASGGGGGANPSGSGGGSGGGGNSSDLTSSSQPRLVTDRGVRAARDIVQFVPFRHFHENVAQLAAQTLAEVPEQVLAFARLHGVKPMRSMGAAASVVGAQAVQGAVAAVQAAAEAGVKMA